MRKITFFTRDEIFKSYGTARHLYDFLMELSLYYKVEVWEMNKKANTKKRRITKCNCPKNLSVSNLNMWCFNGMMHIYISFLQNRRTLLKFLSRKSRNLIDFLQEPELDSLLIERRFDSVGQVYEKRLVHLVLHQKRVFAAGSNYAWLSNLLADLEEVTFTFIHDLRSRNPERIPQRLKSMDLIERLSLELKYAAYNDFLITCNLADQRAIKVVLPKLPVMNVTLSQRYSPMKAQPYKENGGFKILYIDAGGFGDLNIRSFLGKDWPKLRKEFPFITLKIVGNVCNTIKEFDFDENIIMQPWVDDISEVYSNVDLALVLHTYKGGIKVKLFEALKFGVPVVASKEAVDGIVTELATTINEANFVQLEILLREAIQGKQGLHEYYGKQIDGLSVFLQSGYSDVINHLKAIK